MLPFRGIHHTISFLVVYFKAHCLALQLLTFSELLQYALKSVLFVSQMVAVGGRLHTFVNLNKRQIGKGKRHDPVKSVRLVYVFVFLCLFYLHICLPQFSAFSDNLFKEFQKEVKTISIVVQSNIIMLFVSFLFTH